MRLVLMVVVLMICSLVAAPASAMAADGMSGGGVGSASVLGDRAAVGGNSTGIATSSDGATATERIQLTQKLALAPDRPGEIDVTLTYEIPSNVDGLTTHLPDGASVTDAEDFQPGAENEYDWNGRSRIASLTYAIDVNRTTDESEAAADRGSYVFADTGQWALVSRPATATYWNWSGGGTVELDRAVELDGSGAVGSRMVFLGEHTEHVRTAHGQTFRLVVPDVADPVEPPAAILDALEAASNALRVGSRDATVFVVAAPSGELDWGYRGLQTVEADFWVRDDERLDTADNIWLHEYVHTRQSYKSTSEVYWTVEGSAVYYAALLSLEQGLIDFDEFHAMLAEGEQRPYRDAVLANQSTWRQHPDYQKGALVAGEIDRELRLATAAERTFGDVLRAMNAHDGPVTESDFHRMIEQAGGSAVLEDAERYTRTDAVPMAWTYEQHQEAFGTVPARIEPLLVTGNEAYRVSGPDRDRTVGDVVLPVHVSVPATASVTAFDADRTVVDPGESVAVVATVENEAAIPGTATLSLRLDEVAQKTRTVRLDAHDERDVEFTVELEEPGDYVLSLDDHRATVTVVESTPGEATARQAGSEGQPAFGVVTAATVLVLLIARLSARGPRRSRGRR